MSGCLLTQMMDGVTCGDGIDVMAHLPRACVVAHSNGGNVSIIASNWANRPLRRLVELATPVNWDLPRSPWASERCIASSWGDYVQFIGSSPIQQVGPFFGFLYIASVWEHHAANAWAMGDYDAWFAYEMAASASHSMADHFFNSTKIEDWGPTIGFGGEGHSDMHEPDVWYALPGFCKLG